MNKVEWSKAVRDRDGNKCVVCGYTQRIEAHHIKPRCSHPELAFVVDNGVSLCRLHHILAHGKGLLALETVFTTHEEIKQERLLVKATIERYNKKEGV